ncbi:MAG: hypothetical protein SFU98_13775 [Leptospiraceae bacterium]|nr:hypothetical protein [Leptospiraceae bacterium]
MSYDLYLNSPDFSIEEFQSYFIDRKNYTLNDNQAWYENNDTGVYFYFSFNDSPTEDEEVEDYSLLFNLNYFRPHFFSLEAELELLNIINEFDFEIVDPQFNGMQGSKFTSTGFINAWNHGNESGYRIALDEKNTTEFVFAKPTNQLYDIWNWNFKREKRSAELEEDIFIPTIMMLLVDEMPYTAIVWPDAIPTFIPKVDYLYIPREELAPRKFFTKQKDNCLVKFDKALEMLLPFKSYDYEMEAYKIPNISTPEKIKNFIMNLKPYTEKVSLLNFDKVLNLEIIQKYNINTKVKM